MLIGTFCFLGQGVSGFGSHRSQGPGSLAGGERRRGRSSQSLRAGFCPLLILFEFRHSSSTLPLFTMPLLGYSGCQTLWAQGCVSGRRVSKRGELHSLTARMGLCMPVSLHACCALGGKTSSLESGLWVGDLDLCTDLSMTWALGFLSLLGG